MACRRLKRNRKGTFSIEAAIILISFVVIASALAFVVINMGYFAAQKTKDTMEKGILEASSVLELDGSITAYVNSSSNSEPRIQYLIIPVKTCIAKSPIDLSNGSFIVTVVLNNITLPNIYNGTLNEIDYKEPITKPITKLDNKTLVKIFSDQQNSTALAFILTGDGDNVLELNEKAFILIRLAEYWQEDSEAQCNIIGPTSYEMIKIEFRSGEGATMILSRQIPPGLPEDEFIDLG